MTPASALLQPINQYTEYLVRASVRVDHRNHRHRRRLGGLLLQSPNLIEQREHLRAMRTAVWDLRVGTRRNCPIATAIIHVDEAALRNASVRRFEQLHAAQSRRIGSVNPNAKALTWIGGITGLCPQGFPKIVDHAVQGSCGELECGLFAKRIVLVHLAKGLPLWNANGVIRGFFSA